MADILIRGMEMPDGCYNCGFSYFDKGETNGGEPCTVLMCSIINQGTNGADYNGNRPSWCPLVPLPEGHGDLIDRDALKKRTPMVIDYSAGGFGTDGSIRPVRGYGDWQIDQAPTIVPAEGGTDDGN